MDNFFHAKMKNICKKRTSARKSDRCKNAQPSLILADPHARPFCVDALRRVVLFCFFFIFLATAAKCHVDTE